MKSKLPPKSASKKKLNSSLPDLAKTPGINNVKRFGEINTASTTSIDALDVKYGILWNYYMNSRTTKNY